MQCFSVFFFFLVKIYGIDIYEVCMIHIQAQKFDAVIGDMTIVANRTKYVDFALPYTESGVSMVVKIKKEETKNIWIFLKPLRWDLWLSICLAFIFTGIVMWFLDHHANEEEFRSPRKQLPGTILWFSISTLVFANSNSLHPSYSLAFVSYFSFIYLLFSY